MHNNIEIHLLKLPHSLKNEIVRICNNSEYAVYIFYLSAYISIHSTFFYQKDIQFGVQSMNSSIYMLNHTINHNSNFVGQLDTIKQQMLNEFENKNPLELDMHDGLGFLFLLASESNCDYSIYDKLKIEVEKNYDLRISFIEKFYSKSLVNRIGDCFIEFLIKIISSSKIMLSEISLISDKDLLFYKEHASFRLVEYENTTIHDLFKSRANEIPNNIALEYLDQKITYKELDERSDYLANVLQKNGVKQNDIIGLLAQRSPQMVIAILAILKSGAGYLPLNIKNPLERNLYIIKDAEVSILIKDKCLNLEGYEGVIIELDDNIEISDTKITLPFTDTSNLAYAIYTSGSTGVPKGVMIEHCSVINMLSQTSKKDHATIDSVYLLMTNYCFDVSVVELFGWFYSYSRLVILPDGLEMDMKAITEYIISKKVTHMSIVPSVLEMLKRYLQTTNESIPNSLEIISAGGECISYKLAKEIKKILGEVKIINIYGPTEATVFVSYYVADFDDIEVNVPMGRPIQNTAFYVLGVNKQLVPVGAQGELYISGKCLSRGYLNKNQTKERFVNYNEERVYGTGDIVKWSENGYLMFISRNDSQVKINGNRVELEEIERSVLRFSNLIEEVAILAIDDIEQKKRLVCFYLSKTKILVNEIVDYLATILPKYMIPHEFKKLNSIPINSNGKRDTKKLISLANDDSQVLQTAFRSELSLEVADIWKNAIGLYPSSNYDDFFICGGDSLRAISFSLAISQKYKIEFSVADTFANSKFSDICSLIKDSTNEKNQHINDNLIFMRKGIMDQNLFLIHDVSGGVTGYINLLEHIDIRFNCWGIQYPATDKFHPERIDIPKLATDYLESIKEVQKNGPYRILGWSAGGTIAMAIVEELERRNEEIEFLGIIDTFITIEKSYSYFFDTTDEMEFLNTHIPTLHMYNIVNRSGIPELYNSVVSDLPSEAIVVKPEKLKNIITGLYPNFDEFALHEKLHKISQLRSIIRSCNNYRPAVNCEIYYFNAKYSEEFEQHEWEVICRNRLKRFDLNENHFSIMEKNGVRELGRIITSILV